MADVDSVIEALLYEGYVLFPYRRSAMKNRHRWTFGGIHPRGYSETTQSADRWFSQVQCLVEGDEATALEVEIRFLHVVDRQVYTLEAGVRVPVPEARVGERVYATWDEASERRWTLQDSSGTSSIRLATIAQEPASYETTLLAGCSEEIVEGDGCRQDVLLVRSWGSVNAVARLEAAPVYGLNGYRITLRISNITPWQIDPDKSTREHAMRHTLVSAHAILRVRNGAFVSLLEPPASWSEAAGACCSAGVWPVMIGEPGDRDTLLASPIIVYDYPSISPRSYGDLFDATEIDELLTLSVMALTDDEKAEMRSSDPRTSQILARTEALTPGQVLRLHGVLKQTGEKQ